jgi:hypothetical protein
VKRFNRRIPVLKVARDKPSLQTVVASPGWREMSLSARVIAITLFAFARTDANNSVTTDRKGLSYLTGITDPCTLAKANREVQAIGLFQITRGFRTKYAERPTVYRLTWWSQVFQRWLKTGYRVPEATRSATTDTSHHQGTCTSGGFCLPTTPESMAPTKTNHSQPTA